MLKTTLARQRLHGNISGQKYFVISFIHKFISKQSDKNSAKEYRGRKKKDICCHKIAKNNMKYTFLAKIPLYAQRDMERKKKWKLNQEQNIAQVRYVTGVKTSKLMSHRNFFSSSAHEFYPKIFSAKIKIPPWFFRCFNVFHFSYLLQMLLLFRLYTRSFTFRSDAFFIQYFSERHTVEIWTFFQTVHTN